jgi:hypothetical protein
MHVCVCVCVKNDFVLNFSPSESCSLYIDIVELITRLKISH